MRSIVITNLGRAVKSAVIAFYAGVKPSVDDRRKAAAEKLIGIEKTAHDAALAGMSYRFDQRLEFDAQLWNMMERCERHLAQTTIRIQRLREQISTLREDLVASRVADQHT
jgi:hypothetical protein